MKKKLLFPFIAILVICAFYVKKQSEKSESFIITPEGKLKLKSKPENARQLYSIEREKFEFNMQKNPLTGLIPKDEKREEYDTSLKLKQQKSYQKTTSMSFTSRGPSNLGGRTRAFAVDISDPTSNTMLSGGVSSGLFRSTDGGASWVKVSSEGEINNVTAIAQDPRVGFQNIWYYATGEYSGNSASLGSFYLGHGIYKSIDSGLTWAKVSGTDSDQTTYDSYFDLTNKLAVSPITGDLFIAVLNRVYRYDGASFTLEIEETSDGNDWTDVVVTSSGKVYVAIDGSSTGENGVWSSPTGNGSWTRIAQNGTPSAWAATGRMVLAKAPSNDGIIYALYMNEDSTGITSGLWQYNSTTNTWTNYTSKLPDEAGGDLAGNDPFDAQGGYDLVVSVKPDNENFVAIGGTNAYKIEDITTDPMFVRIGGYADNFSYAQYSVGGVVHHPDIHVLEFDPNNTSVLFSGTDGGIHKTIDVTADIIPWISLNNNYITYQYYHVALDPLTGSNIVIGGAQDNGTTLGGTDAGLANNTAMNSIAGGDGVAVAIARRSTKQEANIYTQLYFGTQQGSIYTNYQGSTREITPTDAPSGNDAEFVTYFYLDPDNNDNLYYAANDELYRTSNATGVASGTWISADSLSTKESIRTIATTRGTYNAATSFLLIGGNSGGVFKVDNPKNVTNIRLAKNITPTGASTSSGTIVSDIAIHPTDPNIVLVVYSNYGISNIFLTKNATAPIPTWTLVERNLSAHSIRSTEITQVGTETIYFVGTARGLYSTTDPITKDWELEAANTIGLSLISSLVYRPSDNKLLIGTHGSGMFETTVEGTLSTNDFNKDKIDLSFYPNPTQNELNLQSSTIDLSNNVKYFISDITGKTVKKGIITNKKINVQSLNSGVYLVNLNIEGKKQGFKFIKK
jgi:hypothetical protein